MHESNYCLHGKKSIIILPKIRMAKGKLEYEYCSKFGPVPHHTIQELDILHNWGKVEMI